MAEQKLDAGIGKANTGLCEVYCSVITKRELSNNAKLTVFNGSLFRSSTVSMKVR